MYVFTNRYLSLLQDYTSLIKPLKKWSWLLKCHEIFEYSPRWCILCNKSLSHSWKHQSIPSRSLRVLVERDPLVWTKIVLDTDTRWLWRPCEYADLQGSVVFPPSLWNQLGHAFDTNPLLPSPGPTETLGPRRWIVEVWRQLKEHFCSRPTKDSTKSRDFWQSNIWFSWLSVYKHTIV